MKIYKNNIKQLIKQIDKSKEKIEYNLNKMAMHLGQSTVLLTPIPNNPTTALVTKKISNYIFKFQDKIGQGNFSKVYKGHHQFTNQQVAIKIVQLSSIKSAKLQQLLFSQIEVIQSLHHPNILKCHEVLKSQHNCYIITELCNGGDLQSLLKKEKCLNQVSAAPYIRDIYKGLLYLGERGIVHRDLKSANIFLHNGVCKIADFGFAKYTNNIDFYDLDIGSPLYMSPEGMISTLYGMKTDIWAFGIIIYELLHGQTPFVYCNSEYDLKRAVATPLTYNSIRSDLPNDVKQLILKCLIVDYKHRPDAIALKNDPFIYQLLNSKLEQPHYVKYVQPTTVYQNQNYVQVNQVDPYQKVQVISKTSGSNLSNHSLHFHHPVQQQIVTVQQPLSNSHEVMHQTNIVHYHSPQHSVQPVNVHYYPQNQPHIHIGSQQPHIHIQPQQTHIHYQNQSPHIHIEPQVIHHVESQPHLVIDTHPIQQQYITTQYSSHSPIRIITNSSLIGSKKNETVHINQISSGKLIGASGNIIRSPTYQRNHVYTEQLPILYPKRTDSDTILIPQQGNDKLSAHDNNNFDKLSNSSWSHDGIGKQKFNKSSSHQHLNIQNNLVILNSQPPRYPQEGPKVILRTYSGANDRMQNQLQNQYQPYRAVNQLPTLQHTYSYEQFNIQQKLQQQGNINLSLHNKGTINESSHNKLNFKQQNEKSTKKFGQIIKKDKMTDSNVKSSVKLDILMTDQPINDTIGNDDQQPVIQRAKTKSHVHTKHDQILLTRTVQSPSKKLVPRRSFGQVPSTRQQDIIKVESKQINDNISTKVLVGQIKGLQIQKQIKSNVPHNIITTIMQFKESVGFLHYCRLYNRFKSLLKNILIFPQIKRYQFLNQIFKTINTNIQVYSKYLLTSLNQLIQNIRSKQIIYDGNDYRKKKIKQDKLKQVSQQYYRKYQEEINRNNKFNKISPVYNNTTTIQYIKDHNQKFWEMLDSGYSTIIQLISNGNEFGQNFIKNYRNLCYLSLRIIQANSVILNCINNKTYKFLGEVMIENWIEQEYYNDEFYQKVKNQYFNSNNIINYSNNVNINQSNAYSSTQSSSQSTNIY